MQNPLTMPSVTATPESNGTPRITVVTVVYNRVRQLEETILSVLNLSYSNVEYIIIDGGSTDGTQEIINRYASRLAWSVSERDRGIYDAMNKGISHATGQWINFMNCGDQFASPESLSFFNNAIPDADVLYGDAVVLYSGYELPWINRPINQLWKRAAFCHQATFVKTSRMKDRPFDLRYSISSDFDFLYALYRQGRQFRHVDQLICRYDFREGASVTHQFRSLEERKQVVLSYGFSLWKWVYYITLTTYVRLATIGKKIIGQQTTGWITRFLRR